MESKRDDDWHCYRDHEDNITESRIDQVPQAAYLAPLEVDQATEHDDDICFDDESQRDAPVQADS